MKAQVKAKKEPVRRGAAQSQTVRREPTAEAKRGVGNARGGAAPATATGRRVQPRLMPGASDPSTSATQSGRGAKSGRPSPPRNANKTTPQVGGDTGSSKILHVAWTFDDGPTIRAERKGEKKKNITAAMQKSMTPVNRVTWFIQYNKIKSGNEKENLDRLRKIQLDGGEIGIHAFHEKRGHVSWFPSNTLDSYPSIEDAMADLEKFAEYLKKEGIAVKFVREPYGLVTELAHYLAKLKVPGDQAKRLRIARDVVKDQVSGAESKDPRIKRVQRDLQTMKSSLFGMGLHLWGGSTGSSPEVATQSWQIESSGVRGRTDTLTRKAFEDKIHRVAETGNADSLVILAHDLTSADVDEVAHDKAMMEETARKLKVRIEYCTMRELHSVVRPVLPQLLTPRLTPKVSSPRPPEVSSPAVSPLEVLPPVFPQLELGRVDDPAERAADAMADRVMLMRDGATCCPACAAGSCTRHADIERGQAKHLRRAASEGGSGLSVPAELEPQVRRATSGGEALPQTVRAFFEPRFGEDLSHVRIHRDADASESAQALGAKAYTLGSHIAFGAGKWVPGTGTGDRLIAHELAHVAQQGGQGAESLRRQAEEKKADTPAADKDAESKALTELETMIVEVLQNLTAIEFKESWTSIEGRIKNPAEGKEKPGSLQKKFQGLFDKELVKGLNALSAEQRRVIAQGVYEKTVHKLTGSSAADIKAEFDVLAAVVKNNIEGGIYGYIAMRGAFIETFGTVVAANAYYESLVPADFPSAGSKQVKGKRTLVHPNLKERLQRAIDLLKKKKAGEKAWLDIVNEGIKTIGGLNIRENRNKPSALSDHSFGWAIDIDAALNPNVKPGNFPRRLVEGLTGEDVYKGQAAGAFRTGGTADELLPHAQTLRAASDKFKQGFADEASFKAAIGTYVGAQGLMLDAAKTDALFDKLKTNKRKGVEAWLSETKAAEAQPAATQAPKPEPAAAKPTAGAKPAAKPSWAKAKDVAAFLIEARRVSSRTTTKKGEKIAASTFGSPQTIAAHGFVNLPAELIAALAGGDGAGLNWLGNVKEGRTKDFMHFELKKPDHPMLPKEAEAHWRKAEKVARTA